MNSFPKISKIFLIFSFCVLLFSFIGCSQNLPEIYQTQYSVVFTYDDYTSKPNARLSIFVETGSDPRRCERMEITSYSSDYTWNTKQIEKIATIDRKWAGNVNFIVPENEKIPKGKYDIKYVSADESEKVNHITVTYDQTYYDSVATEVPSLMRYKGVENIAIFDTNRTLLYLGEKTEELTTKGDIFNTYNDAVYYQDVWFSNDNSVICILPENKL